MSTITIAYSAAAHESRELERIGYLDGWRDLAIALVLQHHFFEVHWANFGILGVDIFFCLSGLLMSRILFVKQVPLKLFYKRRISRIMPSFLLYVVTIYSFAHFQGNGLGWIDFASSASFLRSYFPETPNLFQTGYPLAHIWSLNVEEHSYVLLSLLTLVAFLARREGFALIALGFVSISISLMYHFVPEISPKEWTWYRTEVAMSFLVISAGYALLSERINPFVNPWMPIAALAVSFICYINLASWMWVCQTIAVPFLLAFSVNHLAQTPRFFQNILASTPLRFLGISSYSIYLWQQPFYQYSQDFYRHQIEVNYCLLFLALNLGYMMFYLIENPCRTYLNRVW